MKSLRSLQRDLKNIAERMIRDEKRGKDPDPADLLALRITVDLIIERLKGEP
jgi:hypothetical protein